MKDAKKTISDSHIKGFKLSKLKFCLARDYILTSLIFDNASRPGAISNMTLEEFERAIFRENRYVISVKNHKTGYKGPAHIVCTAALFRELAVFKRNFRDKLEGITTRPKDTMFVSWTGGAMDSSLVTTQMGSFWKRALNKVSSKINPTLVRKYTTTTVHENLPDKKQKTANLLCHSLRVAEKNYALYDKQKSAVSASHTVKGAQRCNFNDRDNYDNDGICEYDQIPFKNIFKDELEKQSITIGRVRQVISQKEELFKKFKIDDKFITKVGTDAA